METLQGLGVVASSVRDILPGEHYKKYFPGKTLSNKREELMDMGSVFDTIILMAKVIKLSLDDTKELAPTLEGSSLKQTCKNIWDFAYNHFQYKLDNAGVEELRTPRRSWEDRESGIDCDDYSILVSSILTNLKIPHKLRMAKYNGKSYFQHIYVVVPLHKMGLGKMNYKGEYFTIDPVVDSFNFEVKFSDKHDKDMMPIQMLSGVDFPAMDGGVSPSLAGYIAGQGRMMTFGNEFSGMGDFSGLGNVEVTGEMVATDFLFRLKKHFINTLNALRQNPELVTGEGKKFKIRLEYLLANFDDPQKRKIAFEHLTKLENLESGLQGLGSIFSKAWDGIKNVTKAVGSGVSNAAKWTAKTTTAGLKAAGEGISNAAKWTGKTVATAAKGAWEGVKNAAQWTAKAVIKFNPLTIMIKAGLRLAMRINLFKMAERVGYGYWTEEEARRKGLNIEEWKKVKSKLDWIIDKYDKLEGDTNKLKDAIIDGWKKGVKKHGGIMGLEGSGLGEPVTAATVATAMSVISAILALIKGLSTKKLTNGQVPDQNYSDDNLPEDQLKAALAAVDQQAYNPEIPYAQNVTAGNVSTGSNIVPYVAGGLLLTVVAIKMKSDDTAKIQ